MNFLKYFVFVLLILMGLFILIGLVFKQVRYYTEIVVDRPLGLVWEKFNDPDITMEYIPQIEKITPIKRLPGMVGSTTKYKMGGSRPMDIMETVKSYEEGKSIVLEFDAEGMTKIDGYTFREHNGSTKITAFHKIYGDGIMTRSMYFLMKGLFKRTDIGHQTKFKEIMEERF